MLNPRTSTAKRFSPTEEQISPTGYLEGEGGIADKRGLGAQCGLLKAERAVWALSRTAQPSTWSLTRPMACMKA